jgi:hypothetical protein
MAQLRLASADDATAALFKPFDHWHLSGQKTLPWETVLLEPWRDDFTGDRVKSLMNGLLVMHMAAFNHQTEFYLLTEVDAQKLYNAARNTEAVVWKLSNARNPRGEPVLLSNGIDGNGVANLSFEREFGKLIGIQDTLPGSSRTRATARSASASSTSPAWSSCRSDMDGAHADYAPVS